MWDLSTISTSGTNGNPFPDNDSGLDTHAIQGGRFVIGSGSTPINVDVVDNDGYFSDGDGSQDLANDTTINGTTAHAGDVIDPEFSYTVRVVGTNDIITITVVEIETGGDASVAIISDKPLGAGIEYEFIARVSTQPNIRYDDIADDFIPEAADATLVADSLTVTEDDGPTSINVLDNDTLPAGTTAVLVDTSDVPGGTVTLEDDGTLTFDPGADFQSLGAGESTSFDVTYGVDVEAPLQDPIEIEAEGLHLDGFQIVHGKKASEGALIKTHAHEATATLNDFEGASGIYDLALFIQDETDGIGTINILVNGTQVDSFLLDQQSNGGGSNNSGFTQFDLTGIELTTGDDLTIEGIRDRSEFLRVDRLVLTQTEAASGLGDNLVVNGSFEDVAGLEVTGFGVQDDGGVIPGWSDDLGQAIDLHSNQRGGAVPVDGNFWLDLEASPANNVVSQTIAGIEGGRSYQLSFFMADSQPEHAADDNGVRVFFNGELVFEGEPTSNAFEEIVLTVDGGSGDGSGTLTFEGTGTLDNFGAAIDQVSLREIIDADDPSLTATTTITVTGLNDDPVINGGPILQGTDEDTPVTFSVLDNAEDADGDDVTIAAINGDDTLGDGVDVTSDGGLVGTVTVEANGDLTFNPVPGFDGLGAGDTDTVSFEVTVDDGNGGTATETVTIDVAGVNDDPVINGGPILQGTDEDTPVTFSVLDNAEDADGDDVTIAAINGDDTLGDGVDVTSDGGLVGTVTVEANGDLTFNPVPGFDGLNDGDTDQVSFEVTVADGNGGTATETVTIDVAGVNDNQAPIFLEPSVFFAAENDTVVFGNEALSAIGAVNAVDFENDDLIFSIQGGVDAAHVDIDPDSGELVLNVPFDFEEPGDANGDNILEFTVAAFDGLATATLEAQINILDVDEILNTPPFFTAFTSEGSFGEVEDIAQDPIQALIFSSDLIDSDDDGVLDTPFAIGTPEADDLDGDTLIFSISGQDAGTFEIDEATGVITLANDLEQRDSFNNDDIYEFTIMVEDGNGGSDELNLEYTFFDFG